MTKIRRNIHYITWYSQYLTSILHQLFLPYFTIFYNTPQLQHKAINHLDQSHNRP